MPELPEVETVRRGLAPHVIGRQIATVVVREARLRWPVPASLPADLPGQRILAVDRRGKYLLLRMSGGDTVLVHLGMSGSLRVVPPDTPMLTVTRRPAGASASSASATDRRRSRPSREPAAAPRTRRPH